MENIIEETINQGNPHVISAPSLSWEKYDQDTKWSDHKIIIPTLFNLFHGFEVILKGFLIAKGHSIKSSHKLSELVAIFDSEFRDHAVGSVIKKYVLQDQPPELLSEFCKTSGVTIDDYYQALKYPESTKGKVFSHFPLKYQGNLGLQFFEMLKIDLKDFVKEAVKLSRSICP